MPHDHLSPSSEGLSFKAVLGEVASRAARCVPDFVTPLRSLTALPSGDIRGADGRELVLSDCAQRQLGTLLGVRLAAFMQGASPEERAGALTRALAASKKDVKVRAVSRGAEAALVRGFVAPSHRAIDDARLFGVLDRYLRGLFDDYRFTRLDRTDESTHYTAIESAPQPGGWRQGWHLGNSELGGRALTVDECLVSPEGDVMLFKVEGRRALYRTHRPLTDDQLAAAFVVTFGHMPGRLTLAREAVERARSVSVKHVKSAVGAAMENPDVPVALIERAQERAVDEGGADPSRFTVAMAMAWSARVHAQDADERFAVERLAGDLLLAEVL